MADPEPSEGRHISSDGVSVTKRFEAEEFPVPAIAFEFSAQRETAVTVRLSDTVPEAVEVEDLGFHPEYGSEHWTIDENDDTITFERELDANAEYTTVYGIRATGSDDVEQFMTEPRIETVEPPLSEDTDSENLVPESNEEVVKDVIAGEAAVPGLEETADDTDGVDTTGAADVSNLEASNPDETSSEEVETLQLNDPNDAGSATRGETGAPAETTEPQHPDTLVTRLANEVRQGEVSEDDIELLKRAFETATEDGSTSAKIDRIQSDIADLRAYRTALEEFLDENGTAEELLADFESQVEDFEQQLNRVADTVDSVSNELDDTAENIAQLEDSIEAVESKLERVESQLGEENVVEQIESIEEDLTDLKEWQEQIRNTFGA
jgi:archaellum component FlaC